MFFQLKLQTFFIQVGSDKAEIQKMARCITFLALAEKKNKNKNDPWVLAEMRSLEIKSSTSTLW